MKRKGRGVRNVRRGEEVSVSLRLLPGGGGERSELSAAEKHKLRVANWLVSTTAELGHFRTTQQIWVQLLW